MAKAKNSLGRPAVGLARYYMDVGWYRHPRFSGLPIEALFLFDAGIGYCIGHGTNGEMPGDLEELSIALGVRLSAVRKGAKALLDAGRWRRQGQYIVSAGFGAHNPTKEEVEDWQEERSKSGTRGNHVRWHEARGVVDPECQYCPSVPEEEDLGSLPDRFSDSPSDPNGIAKAIPNRSHGMGWDGMTTYVSSSVEPPAKPPDDDDLNRVVEAIADERVTRRIAAGLQPRDVTAYAFGVVADLQDRRLDDIRSWLKAEPKLTPAQLADRLWPPTEATPDVPAVAPKPVACSDPGCPHCGGEGVVWDHTGDTVLGHCWAEESPATNGTPLALEPFGATP